MSLSNHKFKLTIIIAIAAGFASSCSDDTPVTQETTTPSGKAVYISGTCTGVSDGYGLAGYWKNGTWTSLTDGVTPNEEDGNGNGIALSGSDVYVVGTVYGSSAVDRAGYWKNGKRVDLASPFGNTNGASTTITLSDGKVYVAGTAEQSNVQKPGYWKEGTWKGFTNPVESTADATINGIGVSETEVYLSGYMSNGEGGAVPGYWKNDTWVPLNNGVTGDDSRRAYSFAFTLSGSDAYAAGYSFNSDNIGIPGYWKSGEWHGLTNGAYTPPSPSPVPSPSPSAAPSVSPPKAALAQAITVSGADVYAAGYSLDSSNNFVPGYWKNGTWVGLSQISTTHKSEANAILVSGSDVYVVGYSIDGDGNQKAGFWKNGTWTTLTSSACDPAEDQVATGIAIAP